MQSLHEAGTEMIISFFMFLFWSLFFLFFCLRRSAFKSCKGVPALIPINHFLKPAKHSSLTHLYSFSVCHAIQWRTSLAFFPPSFSLHLFLPLSTSASSRAPFPIQTLTRSLTRPLALSQTTHPSVLDGSAGCWSCRPHGGGSPWFWPYC